MNENALWALKPVSGKIMQEGLIDFLRSKTVQDALTADNLASSMEDFDVEQWAPASAMIEAARTEHGRDGYETRSLNPGVLPTHLIVRVTLTVNREMIPKDDRSELESAMKGQDTYDKQVEAEEKERARVKEMAALRETMASAEARLAELEKES